MLKRCGNCGKVAWRLKKILKSYISAIEHSVNLSFSVFRLGLAAVHLISGYMAVTDLINMHQIINFVADK
jgi:hypothetical protein